MKRKALRGRSEGSIPPYVTEAESRKQHSDLPLCNSLEWSGGVAIEEGQLYSIGFHPWSLPPEGSLTPLIDQMQVFNVMGQEVRNEHLPSGVYLVRIVVKGETYTLKVVIR